MLNREIDPEKKLNTAMNVISSALKAVESTDSDLNDLSCLAPIDGTSESLLQFEDSQPAFDDEF